MNDIIQPVKGTKKEQESKIGNVIGYFILIGIVVGFGYLVYYFYNYSIYYDKPCLENYAKEYCKSQNLEFYDIIDDMGDYDIRCLSDIYNTRQIYSSKYIVYSFLEDEKDNCSRPQFKR